MEHLTISLYDTGALRASANSCALALILAFRALIVLIASLILFSGLCFESLGPFAYSQAMCPTFRGCQRSFGAYLTAGFKGESPTSVAVSYDSSLKGGNLSIGLVIDCELEVFVGGCQFDCRIEECPAPITVVVLMLQAQIVLSYYVARQCFL